MTSSFDSPANKTIAMAYSRVVDALYDIASPDECLNRTNIQTKQQILESSCIRINKIISFDQCGILLVDAEDFDFKLVYASTSEQAGLSALIEKCIDEGTFSWALNQNRAVVLHGENREHSLILHAISIRDKVLGMFIGAYNEQSADFDEAMLALVTIILSKCAYQCEMAELHTALLRQNETLEEQVQERTAELELAKQKAEQATRAKGAFLAMMSHEIRTPMNGVLGMAQMLSRSNLDQEQRDKIDVILSSGHSLLTAINDVLDFSKMEAGKLDIVTEPISVKSLLDEVTSLYQHKADEKNIQLHCLIAPACHDFIIGDMTRLKQILFNLVSNAIKFTPEGSVEIKADIVEQNNDQVTYLFRVTDSGIGIDEHIRHELFTEFTQANVYTTRQYGGTGLGLAICRRLVDMMGGEINVESKIGAGATFWFRISFKRSTAVEYEQKKLMNSAVQTISNKLKLHILLVEDNMVNQMVATAMLDDMGISYNIAENGAVAAQMSVSEKYDLILMDCQMPVMDGYTATRQIRQFSQGVNKQTPIIALSAEVGEGFEKRCLQAGMNDVLSKPVAYNELLGMLQKWTQQIATHQHA